MAIEAEKAGRTAERICKTAELAERVAMACVSMLRDVEVYDDTEGA